MAFSIKLEEKHCAVINSEWCDSPARFSIDARSREMNDAGASIHLSVGFCSVTLPM